MGHKFRGNMRRKLDKNRVNLYCSSAFRTKEIIGKEVTLGDDAQTIGLIVY